MGESNHRLIQRPGFLCGGTKCCIDLYVPQRRGDLEPPIGAGLCRVVDADFREDLFYDVRD